MSIQFYSEDVDLPFLDFDSLKKVLKSKVRIDRCRLGNVNFIFCSDEYLLSLNIKFLQHDYFTDVITFDYTEDLCISGDIYISVDTVKSNSTTFKQVYEVELVRVISHGLLHLLKYNDKEPDEIFEMRLMESHLVDKYDSIVNA
jgi:rRNA maturation RNase YbeY